MPINILMPALSPTMEKGNLAKWLKKEGEAVKTGDVIAEIETDKATMEYEAIEDGVMAKIVVPEGTNDVPVNQLIAVMAQEGEDPKAAADAAGKSAPAKSEAPAAPHPAPSASPSPPQAGGGEKKAEPTPTKPSPLGGEGRAGVAPRGGAGARGPPPPGVGGMPLPPTARRQIVSSPRRWRAVSPRRPALSSAALPARVRMAASSPVTWRPRRRVRVCARPRAHLKPRQRVPPLLRRQ
jgi:pyruvate dehydrogenase E2 component (dihydrolipoamide acetyltransferase)